MKMMGNGPLTVTGMTEVNYSDDEENGEGESGDSELDGERE
jgi:hypothetical protein